MAELSVFDNDPTLYLYTSLTAGSSHIITATSRIETILKANKLPFKAVDTATDELARKLWVRRSAGRKLPALVKEGFVLGDLEQIEEWNEFGELKENVGPASSLSTAAPSSSTPAGAPLASSTNPPASTTAKAENETPLALRQAGIEAAAAAAASKNKPAPKAGVDSSKIKPAAEGTFKKPALEDKTNEAEANPTEEPVAPSPLSAESEKSQIGEVITSGTARSPTPSQTATPSAKEDVKELGKGEPKIEWADQKAEKEEEERLKNKEEKQIHDSERAPGTKIKKAEGVSEHELEEAKPAVEEKKDVVAPSTQKTEEKTASPAAAETEKETTRAPVKVEEKDVAPTAQKAEEKTAPPVAAETEKETTRATVKAEENDAVAPAVEKIEEKGDESATEPEKKNVSAGEGAASAEQPPAAPEKAAETVED